MTRPSVSVAQMSAAHARVVRAEWHTSVSLGLTTLSDVVREACSPTGRPLLRMSLLRLLAERPGEGPASALRILNLTLTTLGLPLASRAQASRLNIQWLVDGRAGGRRILAFTDACDAKDEPPWPGFPYAAAPTTNARPGVQAWA